MPSRERLCSEQKADLSHTAEQPLGKKIPRPLRAQEEMYGTCSIWESLCKLLVYKSSKKQLTVQEYKRFYFRTSTLICPYISTEISQFPQLICSNQITLFLTNCIFREQNTLLLFLFSLVQSELRAVPAGDSKFNPRLSGVLIWHFKEGCWWCFFLRKR